MGICSTELRKYVIQPTLKQLGTCSRAAENLLLGTAAIQSELGFHLKNHQGIGVYSIDEETHLDIWDNYLAFDADLASSIRGLASQHEFLKQPHYELATNLSYATAIAWMIYQQNNVQLPHPDDIEGLAKCWVLHFTKNASDKSDAAFVLAYLTISEKSTDMAA